MALKLDQESALNLTLQGSTGAFRIGSGLSGQKSLEVKYLLTHVSLNFASGSNDALLSELAPVREIFDFQSLDFDEIMQRDIDDSRVSHELIPYLLDEQSSALVKLFPPIVVVVLPLLTGKNRPATKYPHVTYETAEPETPNKQGLYIVRSGSVGQEVFQFEQPIYKGERLEHDLVKLKLNTHRCSLVIVDGQHRAMALLAIYRNLKEEWSDARRAPFREYYAEWTPNYIQQFQLDEISLPLMICTIPVLDDQYSGDYDLLKAARAIFLTLNKNARKVSESRNRLLDDNDIISAFLRRTLSDVKQKDSRSAYSFRIANVELDQHGDKVKIQSPVALTGVNHLYYIIEHLMLNNGDVRGVSPRSGKFYKRIDLETYSCFDRLGALDKLGQQLAGSTKRDSFTSKAGEVLTHVFFEKFGKYIVSAFEEFAPWECHNRAAVRLEANLEKNRDRQLRPILFEGQGIGRVFESHREKLAEKLQDGRFSTDVPQIQATKDSLDATAARLQDAIAEFKKDRAELFMANISDKAKLREEPNGIHTLVVGWLNQLYENVLTSVAFQAALICGFFQEIEKADMQGKKNNVLPASREKLFKEYIVQLNMFFIPQSVAQLKRLIKVFYGEVSGGSVGDWKIIPSKFTFRNVVYKGEMQPDQWPKYKYLISELWKCSDSAVSQQLEQERQLCRKQVFSALHESYRNDFCKENLKLEEKLTDSERRKIEKQAFDALSGFLKSLDCGDLPTLEGLKVEQVDKDLIEEELEENDPLFPIVEGE